MTSPVLPDDAATRARYPMADGNLDYFPNALAEVSFVSAVGNEQHNPGEPMHWAREKSTDHANKIIRHLIDRGSFDSDGTRHSAKVAWRALALLEDELIAEGATPGRNARITAQPSTVDPGVTQLFNPTIAARRPDVLLLDHGYPTRACPSSRHSVEGRDEVLISSTLESNT